MIMVRNAFCSANVTSDIHFNSIPNSRGESFELAAAVTLAGAYDDKAAFSSIFSDSLNAAVR